VAVQKQKRLEQEGREDARQRTIERERNGFNPPPRRGRPRARRVSSAMTIWSQKANDKAPQTAQIIIPVAERLGQNVVDAKVLTKGFGDKLLIENLTFKLPPGGIVGVIGPNGAGKTTLFRMITGRRSRMAARSPIGESVKLGYVDQSRDSLDDKKTVWEEISGGNEIIKLGKREKCKPRLCAAFNFKGGDQQKKVGIALGR
jgi:ATPase subunit of ABC transporter with duplicated ATPase domains